MTRYLLDTNIISNVVKPKPSASLRNWMGDRCDEDLFIASLTVADKSAGRNQSSLRTDCLAGPGGICGGLTTAAMKPRNARAEASRLAVFGLP